jgi:hypothetical protein
MLVLVDGLVKKDTAELYRELAGEMAEWTLDRHFNAMLINEMKTLNYHFICANSSEGADVTKPKYIELPGVKKLDEKEAKARAFLDSMTDIPIADLNDKKSFFGDLGNTSATPLIPIPGQ